MKFVEIERTPGPWRIGDAGHTVFGPKTDAPAPKIVAHSLGRKDARLIAAAPELLEILKEMHKYFITESFSTNKDDDYNFNLERRSMAVIQKAEGGNTK